MVLEVRVTGDKEVRRKLRQLVRSVKNSRRANKQVSTWLHRWVNENFKSQGGKVGGWAPLKPSTIRRRTRGSGIGSPKILQDTGELRARFKPFFGRNFAGIGAGAHSKGRDIPIYHERGIPVRNLPQRRMLPRSTDQDVKRAIIRIYDTYIRRELRK